METGLAIEIKEEFANFRIDVLFELSQLKGTINKLKEIQDSLQTTNSKKEATDEFSSRYYPRCGKKHALHECPLNTTNICILCNNDHPTNECDYLTIAQMSVVAPNMGMNYMGAMGARGNNSFQGKPNPYFSRPTNPNWWIMPQYSLWMVNQDGQVYVCDPS